LNAALLIDFGSTYTKVRAVDLDAREIAATAQGPSTVTTDVNIGLDAALGALKGRLGDLPRFRYRLAASSAAGGLRMVTIGLVRELTAQAAREAALGAGAKLVGCFAYRLTRGDVARIIDLEPDIVLLCGGTDGGDSAVILHNARALARSALDRPIVVAGNRDAAEEIAEVLAAARKPHVVADNVMPELNVLRTEGAREAIRGVFIRRIVHAKGVDRARERLDVLMPTPAAVLDAAELLANGVQGGDGLGELLVVDPGGATTDVHSICAGAPSVDGVVQQGMPEPFAKRTVEGDLGMRHNAASIVEACGAARIAVEARITQSLLEALLARIAADAGRLPESDEDVRLDLALARAAVGLAVKRHAGTREIAYTALGPVQVQRGKDLSRVRTLIGTGGVIAASAAPEAILRAALADPAEPASLRPKAPEWRIDRDYALFACGLLARVERRAAYELAMATLSGPSGERQRESCTACRPSSGR